MTGGRTTRGWLLVLATAVLLLLGGAGIWQAATNAPPSDAARASTIAQGLRCPTCQGLSVADSSAPIAVTMRDLIDEQIADGRTDEQIRAHFVARYGEWILLSPTASGLGWVVWLLPVLTVLGGLVAAARLTRRQLTSTITEQDHDTAAELVDLFGQGRVALPFTPAGEQLEAALCAAGSDGERPDDKGGRGAALDRVARALNAQRNEHRRHPPRGGGAAGTMAPSPRRRSRTVAWASTVAVFGVALAGLLVGNMAPRGAGDLPTGNLSQAESAPVEPDERLALASRLLQAGNVAGAREQALAVLELDPADPDAMLVLGFTLAVDGSADAAPVLRRFLDVAPPDHPGRDVAESLLDEAR